jgi:uncharacterized protein HemX
LIRPQRRGAAAIPSFSARWGAARWLVPAAAMLLLALGIYVRNHSQSTAFIQQASVVAPAANTSDLDDADLMQEVSANAPAMKTQYEENLRQVNESIHDAQGMVNESPNDEDARRSLEDASDWTQGSHRRQSRAPQTTRTRIERHDRSRLARRRQAGAS